MSGGSDRFRFRPPAIPATPELRWALLRAFGPVEMEARDADAAGALEIAGLLGLLPRIALRCDLNRVGEELGGAASERLRRERARGAAQEMLHDETLAAVREVAAQAGIQPALLKGRALVHAGYTAPGARASADLDLLLPTEQASELRRRLAAAGFRDAGGRAYDHQLPPLLHPGGVPVEIHLHVPGVRCAGRSFARWQDLMEAGALEPASAAGPAAGLLLPTRPLLVAHTLVHALAQHGLAARGPGWVSIGDLIDLDATEPAAQPPAAWIGRDLSSTEVDAALDLAHAVAAGDDPFDRADSHVASLAAHFVACATDAAYGDALKLRWLEAPLSDRGRPAARLRLFLSTFVPNRTGTGQPGLRSWLARPLELARKFVRARRSQRHRAP